MLSAGFLLALSNNVFNPKRVPWLGSPRVLPKPEGWPSLTFMEGLQAGYKHGLKELTHNWKWALGVFILLIIGIWASKRRHKPVQHWVFTWLRVLIGLMFIAAAYPKFTDPKAFSMLVAQYQLLPALTVYGFSLLLPAVEIVVGSALIFSPFERENAVGVSVLMSMFIVALAQALTRGLGIACGCFDLEGATDPGETWFAMMRDILLLIPLIWIGLKGKRRFLWHF